MHKIIVTKRGDDYHASLAGRPEIWGCGKTINAAIGNLVQSHTEALNVKVELK